MRRGTVVVTMTLDEIKSYFENAGGKKKVKDTDPVWAQLIKIHNNHPSNRTKQLTFSCGNCRREAYAWMLTQ